MSCQLVFGHRAPSYGTRCDWLSTKWFIRHVAMRNSQTAMRKTETRVRVSQKSSSPHGRARARIRNSDYESGHVNNYLDEGSRKNCKAHKARARNHLPRRRRIEEQGNSRAVIHQFSNRTSSSFSDLCQARSCRPLKAFGVCFAARAG